MNLNTNERRLVETLLWLVSKNGGELSRQALAKLLSLRYSIAEESFDISDLIGSINTKLPSQRKLNVRRGHRDYFVKVSASTRRRLLALL